MTKKIENGDRCAFPVPEIAGLTKREYMATQIFAMLGRNECNLRYARLAVKGANYLLQALAEDKNREDSEP